MCCDSKNMGYTLVELVVVIVLIGIISAVGASLFLSRSAFSPLLATQQLSAATLLAQQAALAGNSAGRLTINQTAEDFVFTVGSGTLNARTFSLDRAGTTLSGASLPLTLTFNIRGEVVGGGNTSLTFNGESAYQTCISSLGAVYAGGCQP
ncbi:prepilin-type N-terminal cleavage/methylation domain-containing protein [Marinobacter sp. M216]|uniref:Prepilin-type N-terminal cleavage/methylation domain-containing protein n=1 Tax=Marinobacter albus TaxID=3030833 RepID=A0ABT7HGV9_9GAMM|nr:prepilin-type N-terminal cleavage/methylation domain-containing protein [Marinobacter sp. M216]MDK9559607.1 prepilin-type N-terminal cleavage/methylation domain-containing protein [Marinobacter sp. M216]